ncbi:hypothetical protein DFQ30_005089 [Apophysomyces sp. BC1015]|nr:hypothetical protein DFQ30_005089 [Apophysomyces sp. BC1015]KAG0177883.1 hypothetical protein DFQ29_004192 [Apophysomyces sp. BC1021]
MVQTRLSSVASTSTDPMPESMEAPSPAASISTIGSMGASQLDISADSFSVKASALTAHPQLFLPILFRILQVMENWNVADQELPAMSQPEATPVWPWHWLQSLQAWGSLNHRRRTSLVWAINKLVSNQALLDPARLSQELAEGTFTPPTYLVRSQARLFTIAPVAAFTRKYVKINHETLGIILRHFELGQHAAMLHTSVPTDRPHTNFNIIDLNKMKGHGATSITFKKLVPENPLPSIALDDIKEEHLAQGKIWGDASTYEDPSTAANAPHQVLQFSAAEHFTKAKMKKTNASILEWKQADGITAIEAVLPSSKSARMSNIKDHVRAVLQALPRLLSHYGTRYQQLRSHNYRGKQKMQKEMVDTFLTSGAKYNGDHHKVSEAVVFSRIRADGQMRRKRKARSHTITQAVALKPNKCKKTMFQQTHGNICNVVCVGGGAFGWRTFRGKVSGQENMFRKLLKRAESALRLICVPVNEEYTSQVCSSCGLRDMDNVEIDEQSKLHSVLLCNNCGRVWQRDCNAVRNIHALVLLAIRSVHGPQGCTQAFTREQEQETIRVSETRDG